MKKIIELLYDLVFGCHHSHTSRAFTIQKRTYVVCCDCGREFAYSLELMRIVTSVDNKTPDIAGLAVLHSH